MSERIKTMHRKVQEVLLLKKKESFKFVSEFREYRDANLPCKFMLKG